MTSTLEKLTNQALKLPQSARAYLAERLLDSLEQDDDFEVSSEWLAEARRRGRELDSGRGRAVNGEVALKRLRTPASR